jgi:hypothetical protein
MSDPAIQTSVSHYNGGGSTTCVTGAFGSNITATDVIACTVWTRQGDVVTGVTDTLGNTYALVAKLNAYGTTWIYLFHVLSSLGGANNVTSTASIPCEMITTAIELPPSSGSRVSNTAAVGSGQTTVNLAGTVANDVVAAIASNNDSTDPTSSSVGSNAGFPQAILFGGDVDYTFDGNSSGGTIAVSTTRPSPSAGSGIVAIAYKPPVGVARALAAVIVAQATATDNLTAARSLADVVIGRAAMADALTVTRGLRDTIVGISSLSDSLSAARALIDTIAARAAVAASLSETRGLAASVLGRAVLSLSLSEARSLTDAITGRASTAASLTLVKAMTATVAGRATLADSVAVSRALTDSILGHAALASTIKAARSLQSSVAGRANMHDQLAASRSLHTAIAGDATLLAAIVIAHLSGNTLYFGSD